ncbi:MAG TPA: hypothetical protein VNV43_04510 [Candidatus Acidoferrales bacterium]|jgi:hypothetical protein|nr:hypothetical protein [Candidatus Acidoferrales bacterium]
MKKGTAKRQKRLGRPSKAAIKRVAEVNMDESNSAFASASRVFIFDKSAAKSSSALNGGGPDSAADGE